jgi:hypothetical protein
MKIDYLPLRFERRMGKKRVKFIDDLLRDECSGAPTMLHMTQSEELMTVLAAAAIQKNPEISSPDDLFRAIFISDVGSVQIWLEYHWRNLGRPTYDLSSQLASDLMQTDVNIHPRDIEVPGGSSYISAPHMGNLWTHDHGHVLPVEGFMIKYVDVTDLPREKKSETFSEIDPDLYGVEVGGRRIDFTGGTLRNLSVLVCAPPIPGEGIEESGFVRFMIPLNLDSDLEEWIVHNEKNERALEAVGEHNVDHMGMWSRMIMNTLAYLDVEGADIEAVSTVSEAVKKKIASAKSRKQRGKLAAKHRGPLRLIQLGHRQPEAGPRDAHDVRGHYRHQAHGPQMSLRKRIWIKPHRRGRENLGDSQI